MKVVSSKQMAYIESIAYREGESADDFMEEAGSGVALIAHDFAERYALERKVFLLCGKGNNAGDAYVAAIHLLHLDYEVTAYQLFPLDSSSSLCRYNASRFVTEGGRLIETTFPQEISFPASGLIIDGIFGTGFKGEVEAPISFVIDIANQSNLPVIAIDIPSGLNGDTGAFSKSTIIATETAFLGLPKTGFFLQNGWNYVGKLRFVDFGLPENCIEQAHADLIMISKDIVRPRLPKLIRNRHKYEAGYVVALAGSQQMAGAAVLSSLGALLSGTGIVRLLYKEGMETALSASPAELIKTVYQSHKMQEVLDWMQKAKAVLIGPGIGRTPEMLELLAFLLPKLKVPCVIDADALTLWADMNEPPPFPGQTILTPHHGEMAKLLKKEGKLIPNQELLAECQAFAEKHSITLILKGGPSFIFQKAEPIRVNPTGDPGMATAGSGDVLTGILSSMLAQGLSPSNAAMVGVFLHGLGGEHAAAELTSYCMTASDIIYHLPEAFRLFEL